MEITHTWNIRKLVQKNDGSGIVIQVYFKVHSTDEEYYYVSSGSVDLDVDEIQNFISYQDLTQQQVITWVKDKLGPDLGGYQQINTNWINDKKNPSTPTTKIERLPWEPDPILETQSEQTTVETQSEQTTVETQSEQTTVETQSEQTTVE